MLGHRGCRLGITYPEITRMQARAIFEAACQVAEGRDKIIPEVMVPLVGAVKELSDQKALIIETAETVMKETGVQVEYMVGTMIEVPRAALTADEIAEEAEFFSFGTNDLTQMRLRLLARRQRASSCRSTSSTRSCPRTLRGHRPEGVGLLMQIAVEKGRASPARTSSSASAASTAASRRRSMFCYGLGLNYVSCSPFRVPIARLAAAQAALGAGGGVNRTA